MDCGFEDALTSSRVSMHQLGDVLLHILKCLDLRDRVSVACTSRDLRDFVYDNQEILFPNLSLIAHCETDTPSNTTTVSSSLAPFTSALEWASKRRKIRRLRTAVFASSANLHPLTHATTALARCLPCLDALVSLDIRFDVVSDAPWIPIIKNSSSVQNLFSLTTTGNDGGNNNQATADFQSSPKPRLQTLIRAINPSTLRQLVLRGSDIHIPTETSRLSSLTALIVISDGNTAVGGSSGGGSGVTLASDACLPPSLRRLTICGLDATTEAHIPPAVSVLSSLQALTLDWGGGGGDAPLIDLSLFDRQDNQGDDDYKHLENANTRNFSNAKYDYCSTSLSPPRAMWFDTLTHLSLTHFRSPTLPKNLPRGLVSFEWRHNAEFGEDNMYTNNAGGNNNNLSAATAWHQGGNFSAADTATATAATSAATSADRNGVATYHDSFTILTTLQKLTHLCLNNSLGGYGLPPAVMEIQNLKSLGAVGGSPFGEWEGRWRSVAQQMLYNVSASVSNENAVFSTKFDSSTRASTGPHQSTNRTAENCYFGSALESLDIEISDAATNGGEKLARALPQLKRLRLAKADDAEMYVAPAARHSLICGLVNLLPALPHLKECSTEGMLLPATTSCCMWARLLGPGTTPAQREQALQAVQILRDRKVVLERWYTGSGSGGSRGVGEVSWDEVELCQVEAVY